MSSNTSLVREIIGEYIKPNGTLSTMNRIHNEFFSEHEDFNRWEDVEMEYISKDWTDERVREFALTSKEVIESGIDELAESYLDIVDEEVDAERIKAALEQKEINDERDTGFRFTEQDNGMISGVYFYKTVDVDITSNGQVGRLTNEKSIPFRIDPEKRLVIAETTYSPFVQKLGGVFRNELNIPVSVCGDITALPNQATDRVSNFLNSFERETERGDWE